MRLARRRGVGVVVSLTPLVDVMLIMLVFFMVTSTYLHLDMIPMVERGQAPPGAAEAMPESAADPDPDARSGVILVRLTADGRMIVRGEAVPPARLGADLAVRAAGDPRTRVLILPSGEAPTQALVSLLALATRAGVTDVRVVRLEVP